jgi:hypothetical protein
MCRNWIAAMTAERRDLWGVPDAEFTQLETLFKAAEALLQKAQDEAERTHVITVELQAAFKALTEKMRFFRDRYFKLPPLTEGDWAALGFRAKDPHPTPIPPARRCACGVPELFRGAGRADGPSGAPGRDAGT